MKPEKYKGDCPKTTHFLVEFGRYLCLNKEVYPTESDAMDLFLLCIDHPWADQCSLEIDKDYFNKEAGEHWWEELKTLRHAFQKHFSVLNKKDKAKAQVYRKMDNYIKKFEEIAPKTLINDKGLLVYFQKGLLKSICKKLWDAQLGPEMLEEWKEAAVKAEGQHNVANLWK